MNIVVPDHVRRVLGERAQLIVSAANLPPALWYVARRMRDDIERQLIEAWGEGKAEGTKPLPAPIKNWHCCIYPCRGEGHCRCKCSPCRGEKQE